MLPALTVAVMTALSPATAPVATADLCLALTPAVVERLRASGALESLVPAAVPTPTLIAAARSVTGCAPVDDPDPATVTARLCPLLTTDALEAIGDRFGATPAVRASIEPERVALARGALECDGRAATPAPIAAPSMVAPTTVTPTSADGAAPPDTGLPAGVLALGLACALFAAGWLVLRLLPRMLARPGAGDDRPPRRDRAAPGPVPVGRSEPDALDRQVAELRRANETLRTGTGFADREPRNEERHDT